MGTVLDVHDGEAGRGIAARHLEDGLGEGHAALDKPRNCADQDRHNPDAHDQKRIVVRLEPFLRLNRVQQIRKIAEADREDAWDREAVNPSDLFWLEAQQSKGDQLDDSDDADKPSEILKDSAVRLFHDRFLRNRAVTRSLDSAVVTRRTLSPSSSTVLPFGMMPWS